MRNSLPNFGNVFFRNSFRLANGTAICPAAFDDKCEGKGGKKPVRCLSAFDPDSLQASHDRLCDERYYDCSQYINKDVLEIPADGADYSKSCRSKNVFGEFVNVSFCLFHIRTLYRKVMFLF